MSFALWSQRIGISRYASREDIPDLSGYAKQTDIPAIPATPDLGEYVNRAELPDFDEYALRSELPNLNSYTTLADIPPIPTPQDLSAYVLRSELPTSRPIPLPRVNLSPTAKPKLTSTPTPIPIPTQQPTATPIPSPTATQTPIPTSALIGHSLTNPVPPGTTVLTHDGLALTLIAAEYTRVADITTAYTDVYVIRVRAQNVGGYDDQEYSLYGVNFRLLTSSGNAVPQYDEVLSDYCTSDFPNNKNIALLKGGSVEGILCFDTSEDEGTPVLFYEPKPPASIFYQEPVAAHRRWITVGRPTHIEPLRQVAVSYPSANQGLGPLDPAPRGTSVRTHDGLDLTVIDHTDDATQLINDFTLLGIAPLEKHRVTLIRVRIRNTMGPDELSLSLFREGTGEGNICFEIPEDETGLVLIYDPVPMFEPQWTANRRWLSVIE